MQGAGIEPGASSAMDGDILARARGGDLAAFEAIAVERLPGLYRLAHAILGGDAEAAEATCSTLVGAWHELLHLDDPARFDDWLDRILISECRMDLERAHRGDVSRAPEEPGAAAPTAADGARRGAMATSWTGTRSSACWTARSNRSTPWIAPCLVLHDLEGRPPAAIAGTLHMPLATVKWRLHEAHLVLRAALEVPA